MKSPVEYEEITDVSSQITVKIAGASVHAYKSGRMVFLNYMGNVQSYTAGQLYEVLELPLNLRPKTDFFTLGIGTASNLSPFNVYFKASDGTVKISSSDTSSRRCAFGISYLVG
jgi:hypothetical protein